MASMFDIVWRSGRWLGALSCAVLMSEGMAEAWAPSCEPAERYTLKNGLEVVLSVKTSLPTVAVLSSVHVGARDDPPGYEGLAHYVEHLTFLGVPPFASSFDLYQEIGANALNGTTSPDTTDYFALVPSSQLERAIWIEARRLGLGLNELDDASALSERRVVLREHALRFSWEPGYELYKTTLATLFPPEHPYHSMVPSEASTEQLTLNDARSFFAQYYRPDRTRLVLVGGFEPAAAKALIERYFGGLDPGTASQAPTAADCHWAKQAFKPSHPRIALRTRSRHERLSLYWPVRPDEEPEALRGVFAVLKGELSASAEQTGLSHDVNGYLEPRELGSDWRISIEVAPAQPFEKVEPLFKQVVANLRSSFADEQALNAQRQSLELSDVVSETRLLDKAQYLARRECQPAACIDATTLLTRSAVNQMDRFALEDALVVEERYSVGASDAGDIEVAP